jgi:hypothetical protein
MLIASTFACEQLSKGLGGEGSGGDAGVTTDAGVNVEGGVVGGGCGMEPNSGTQLCVATSMCPNVVVDTQAMPDCGFRIRGGAVDLVCACGAALCPMGIFATCADAANLLANQTQQGVCVQLAEGRCLEASPTSTSSTSSSSSSSSGASSSGGNPACDRQCVADCGGGAGCAAVCNCD